MKYWRDCGLEFEFIEHSLFKLESAEIILEECKFPISKNETDFLHWVVKRDESCGIEITTPIIDQEIKFSNIKKFTDSMNYSFTEEEIIDSRCGLHVHIDTCDYKDMQCIKNLVNITSILEEKVIYKIIQEHRIKNKYCKSTNFSKKLNGFGKDISKFKKNIELNFDRNRGLNLGALQKFGTVEFRYHHATIDYNEIWNWVSFLQKIVQFASCPESKQIINLINKYNIETNDIFSLIELEEETKYYILNKKVLKNYVRIILPEKK